MADWERVGGGGGELEGAGLGSQVHTHCSLTLFPLLAKEKVMQSKVDSNVNQHQNPLTSASLPFTSKWHAGWGWAGPTTPFCPFCPTLRGSVQEVWILLVRLPPEGPAGEPTLSFTSDGEINDGRRDGSRRRPPLSQSCGSVTVILFGCWRPIISGRASTREFNCFRRVFLHLSSTLEQRPFDPVSTHTSSLLLCNPLL